MSQKITVIREEAEKEALAVDVSLDPILKQVQQITLSETLLSQIKGTELSHKIQSLNDLLFKYHQSFELQTTTVSNKQNLIIRAIRNLQNNSRSLAKFDLDLDKCSKKISEIGQLRFECQKLKSLVHMMSSTVEDMEKSVDAVIEARIRKLENKS